MDDKNVLFHNEGPSKRVGVDLARSQPCPILRIHIMYSGEEATE